jgi:hypothetical protein
LGDSGVHAIRGVSVRGAHPESPAMIVKIKKPLMMIDLLREVDGALIIFPPFGLFLFANAVWIS